MKTFVELLGVTCGLPWYAQEICKGSTLEDILLHAVIIVMRSSFQKCT